MVDVRRCMPRRATRWKSCRTREGRRRLPSLLGGLRGRRHACERPQCVPCRWVRPRLRRQSASDRLDNLQGADLDGALLAYVRRAQTGSSDAALVTGTGKDLLEAAARRVIQRAGNNYDGMTFPGTLYQALYLAGLTPSAETADAVKQFGRSDARQVFVDALYLAGCATNALRNQEGTGHGRPFLPTVTAREARAAVQVMGVISELLLKTE